MPIRFGEFELDEGRRQLLRCGKAVDLPAKQLLLLQILLKRRPNAVSKQDLYDQLWPSTYVSEVNLPGLVADLRAALEDDAHQPRFIRTVHGFGYAFCGEADSPAELKTQPVSGVLSAVGLRIDLASGETVIGRDPTLRASIDHASVSRRHAAVTCSGDSFVIRDLGSKNGTFVGGVRLHADRELKDGDVVAFGSVRLVFHRPTADSTMTVQPDLS